MKGSENKMGIRKKIITWRLKKNRFEWMGENEEKNVKNSDERKQKKKEEKLTCKYEEEM